jgi:hypothetical protein
MHRSSWCVHSRACIHTCIDASLVGLFLEISQRGLAAVRRVELKCGEEGGVKVRTSQQLLLLLF